MTEDLKNTAEPGKEGGMVGRFFRKLFSSVYKTDAIRTSVCREAAIRANWRLIRLIVSRGVCRYCKVDPCRCVPGE